MHSLLSCANLCNTLMWPCLSTKMLSGLMSRWANPIFAEMEKEANGSTAPAVPMAAAQSTLSVRDRKHERFISKTLTEEAAKRASQARELFLSRIDFIRQSDDLFDLGDDVKSPKLRSKLAVATERDPAPARVLSPHLKATLEIFEKGASAGPVVEGRTRGTSAAI